ncbi:MAG TPA: hypothetical protein VMW78_03295 [Anaerolineae bacterium]|nr:hypothetical protein [Anaerolineae bacterium]
MKKFALIVILSLFVSACGTLAKESEFFEHDTMYKNWDHLKFSIYGFKCPSVESSKKTDEQGWWGKEIPINPDK